MSLSNKLSGLTTNNDRKFVMSIKVKSFRSREKDGSLCFGR